MLFVVRYVACCVVWCWCGFVLPVSVVCCALRVVRVLLRIVCCVLFAVRCSLLAVRCALSGVCCLFVDC